MPVTGWMRERPWAGDAALAVLVAVPAGASTLNLLQDAGDRVVLAIVAVVLHATVATRRMLPVVSFAVAALCEAGFVIAPLVRVRTATGTVAYSPVLLPSSVVFLLVLYAVAAYAPRPAASAALVVGVVGAAATTVRLALAPDVVDGAWTVAAAAAGLLIAVVAAWTLGLFRRLQAEQAEQLRAEQAQAAVRDERARIARDLHDVVSHSLAVVVRQADAGRFVARSDAAAAEQVFTTIADTGRTALGDMRSLLGVLRTDGTEQHEPAPTTADVDTLVERIRSSGQEVRLQRRGEPVPLAAAAELAAYRLVQEGLTNVVKHAGSGASAEVLLAWEPTGLTVTVRDDGGRERRRPVASGGHGITGLRERVQLAGGSLETESGGDGFVLSAHLPGAAS